MACHPRRRHPALGLAGRLRTEGIDGVEAPATESDLQPLQALRAATLGQWIQYLLRIECRDRVQERARIERYGEAAALSRPAQRQSGITVRLQFVARHSVSCQGSRT